MKKLSGSSYSLIIIMVVMLVIIGLSLRLHYVASKVLPVGVSIIVFVLAAVELWKGISARSGVEATVIESEASAKEKAGIEGRKYLPIGAWLAGCCLAIYLIGFIIASLLFVLLYMKWYGSRWVTAIISAVLFTGIIYSVFELILEVDLYPGLLRTWLGF